MTLLKHCLKALVAVSIGLCCVSAHAQERPHSRAFADTDDRPAVGVQVKVERFTPSMAKQIKASGFEFVRFGVWADAMRNAAYQNTVTAAFDAAHHAGLPVLVTVRSTTSLLPQSQNQAAQNSQLRESAKRLVKVVRKLVTEHDEDVLAVELWNEPELPRYWPTGNVDSTFPVYFSAVCAELKSIRMSTPVVGFGFATPPLAGSRSDRLLKNLFALRPGCVDAISYHSYGMNVGQIRDVSSYVKAQYGLPVLISEWGISSGAKKGKDGQADGIRSFLMSRRSIGTALVSIYEWQDTATGQNARERNFGLVDAYDAEKPALNAANAALRQ